MLAAYRKQDWETVDALLELMKDQSDKAGIDLDIYLFMYETRVLEFREKPARPRLGRCLRGYVEISLHYLQTYGLPSSC